MSPPVNISRLLWLKIDDRRKLIFLRVARPSQPINWAPNPSLASRDGWRSLNLNHRSLHSPPKAPTTPFGTPIFKSGCNPEFQSQCRLFETYFSREVHGDL